MTKADPPLTPADERKVVIPQGIWLLSCVLASVVFSVGCNHPNAQAAEEPITTDEACELLVTHALRELFDGWATRYQYVVWCNRGDQKSIHVAITPSNRQELRQDPALMQRQAEAAIDGLLKRKQWQGRYTKVVFQFL